MKGKSVVLGGSRIITKATSGIGFATANLLAREGMKVVLADIETDPLSEAVEKLKSQGREVLGVPTDVSSWEQVEALAERSVDHFGAVHVLHSNAGVVLAGLIEELSLEDWKWVIDVNLWSVIYGIKAFLPRIREAGEGHVVATASTAGLVSTPTIAPYNMTKFGVIALQETLQRELELEKSPIRASVLCPGAINTRIVEAARNRPSESAKAHVGSKQENNFLVGARDLLGKGMDPAEVAEMVMAAIREQQFWILTHSSWNELLRERVEGMVSEGRLTHGFGG